MRTGAIEISTNRANALMGVYEEMIRPSNAQAFYAQTGAPPPKREDTTRHALISILTDLMHWADAQCIDDFDEMVENARAEYEEEVNDQSRLNDALDKDD